MSILIVDALHANLRELGNPNILSPAQLSMELSNIISKAATGDITYVPPDDVIVYPHQGTIEDFGLFVQIKAPSNESWLEQAIVMAYKVEESLAELFPDIRVGVTVETSLISWNWAPK